MNIKRIKADLETAKKLTDASGNPTNDEYLYDIAAYHTQQAVEKSLKYCRHNVYGEDDTAKRYRTHNISSLLLMISEYDVNFLRDNAEIVKMSDEITGWEASSRYGESLVAT